MTTDDLQPTVQVPELVGKARAHAYLINHGAHGYGKFILDEHTLAALEAGGLHKIDSSLARKQIYNMLYDMVISTRIPGSRVIRIFMVNISHGESEDVLVECFRSLVPAILAKFVPMDSYDRM